MQNEIHSGSARRDVGASYRETYCVFEGGGAIGALHVGVLRALQKADDYEIKGYAGTSAGALVALLAAAGFTGRQMIGSLENGVLPTILDALKDSKVKNATDLIGPGWGWIQIARRLLGDAPAYWLLEKWRGPAFLLILIALFGRLAWLWPGAALALLIAVLVGSGVLAVRTARRGLARLDALHGHLQRLVCERLEIDPVRSVTFAEFEALTGMQLKIVSSNLTRRRMQLFSGEATPRACVIDAAVASAAIPGLFGPRHVAWPDDDGQPGHPELHCDGGLVSNLPAWSLESAYRLNRNCLIIASELGGSADLDPTDPGRGVLKFLGALARTAVFGGAELNTRGLDRLIRVFPSDGSIRLLDFDIKKESLAAAVDQAEKLALSRLKLERDLRAYTAGVREASLLFIRELYRNAETPAPDDLYVRCALAIHGRYRSKDLPFFRLAYCQGFEPFADERARYPMEGSVAGDALLHQLPLLLDVEEEKERFFHLGSDGWAAKLSPKDLKWSLCVPTKLVLDFKDDQSNDARWIVVTVDSNAPLSAEQLLAVEDHVTRYILDFDPAVNTS